MRHDWWNPWIGQIAINTKIHGATENVDDNTDAHDGECHTCGNGA